MSEVKRNAWEPNTTLHARRGLAGSSTDEKIEQDREQRAAEMVKQLAIAPEKAGFEIGSGNGLVARLLSPQCARLDCNDISDAFLREARRACADCANVFFHKIRDDYLQHLPEGRFDFGYALNVFIHFNIYDIFHYLRDVRRLLKSGGAFHFDACMLGPQTVSIFRQHAVIYRGQPEGIRGLLNFNTREDIELAIAEIGGLTLDRTRSQLGSDGWLKVVVTRD